MTKVSLTLGLAVSVLACGPGLVGSTGADDSPGSTSDASDGDQATGPTGGPETTGGLETTSDSETTGDTEPPQTCEVLEQDCESSEKCVPDPDGDAEPICVPVLGVGSVGQACSFDPDTRTDDCDADSFCWVGECRAFCVDDAPNNLPCTEWDTQCWAESMLCMSQCNSLADNDCPPGMGCYLNLAPWVAWVCLPSPGDAAHGQPCEQQRSCLSNHACLPAEAVPGCSGSSCCAQACDTWEADSCADQPGTACALLVPDPWCENYDGLCMTPGWAGC